MTRDPMHSRHVLMLRAACWTKAAPIPAGCPVRQTRWALRRFVSLKTKQKPRCSCVTEAACRHCAPLPARGAKTCFLPRRCGPPFIRCCPAPRQSLCACAVPHTTAGMPQSGYAARLRDRLPCAQGRRAAGIFFSARCIWSGHLLMHRAALKAGRHPLHSFFGVAGRQANIQSIKERSTASPTVQHSPWRGAIKTTTL